MPCCHSPPCLSPDRPTAVSVNPRITTIVPTYRRPLLLKRAVLSVLNQSYPHFIVQILDNASGDATQDVARELMRQDARVRYHRHEENVGSLNNIIFGIQRIDTEYFSILSDDDLLMPGFFENGLDAHEQASGQLAFVAERVVVVDEHGRFAAPYPHQVGRLSPPDGIARCLKAGVSLPGVLYRTSVVRSIGVPRVAWWNWTESGWHALAAVSHPIEMSPELGAIVFVHPDSGSKKMDATEFRTSWFRMLAEVRGAAMTSAVSPSWWRTQILPTAYVRFLGTIVRLCTADGANTYDALGRLGVASGLSVWFVRSAIGVARVARTLGIGRILNGIMDWMATPGGAIESPADSRLNSAVQVFSDLNHRAGLT